VSSSQNVTVDEQVIKTCQTDLNSPVELNYYCNHGAPPDIIAEDGKINNGNNLSFRAETPLKGEYRLISDRIKLSNSGIYVCIEGAGFGPGSASLELTVLRRPFRVSPSLVVEAGCKVVLKCEFGLDDRSVEWLLYRPSGRPTIVSSQRKIMNGFSRQLTLETTNSGDFNLVLERAAVDNTGDYECTH
jgi:hypothetical protein